MRVILSESEGPREQAPTLASNHAVVFSEWLDAFNSDREIPRYARDDRALPWEQRLESNVYYFFFGSTLR